MMKKFLFYGYFLPYCLRHVQMMMIMLEVASATGSG